MLPSVIANAIEVTALHFTAKLPINRERSRSPFVWRLVFGGAVRTSVKRWCQDTCHVFIGLIWPERVIALLERQTLNGECSARNLQQNGPAEYPDGSPGRRVLKILVF